MACDDLWFQGIFPSLESIQSFLDYTEFVEHFLWFQAESHREGGNIFREQSWSKLRKLGNGSSSHDSDYFICEVTLPHCRSEQSQTSRTLELNVSFNPHLWFYSEGVFFPLHSCACPQSKLIYSKCLSCLLTTWPRIYTIQHPWAIS